ncbi:hypothetical protein [Glaciimonas sp. PCH181]|uniref:hypothetical protein n=1 Tax=Glaciimonas sp. PCH181 TaxID=2133943 RepID=UPI0011B1FA98|nr:hypothetical protein [Glaciimonas sp. PCH181]
MGVIILITGCATRLAPVEPPPSPVTLLTLANKPQIKILARRVTITLAGGYSIMLMDGSHWVYLGNVPDGKVYKPKTGMLMNNDKLPHEFYIVAAGKQLIGFYMPEQRLFTPLEQPLYLTFDN